MAEVFVLGVRHHGPGSARAVGEALAEIDPDAVLIEGAPELDAVAALAGGPDMVPPVAGLVYAVDEPKRSSFYPLADFSPEWVALRWALAAGRPVRFCDLPAAHSLALDAADRAVGGEDPIGALAAAAGYDDPERWWEDVIEHRFHGLAIFAAVTEAMAALRQAGPTGAGAGFGGGTGEPALETPGRLGESNAGSAEAALAAGSVEDARLAVSDEYNERREAAMRKAIRAALKSGAGRLAVVCGAWHAPALLPAAFPSAAADNARLKGLPKLKVAATWVPWTSALLARRSGYGAGVDAPGWYRHLATAPDAAPTRFLVKAARLLRDRGHDVSPAATVEAVRLAEGLAALRGRPGPGLGEVLDAAEAALAGGSPVPLKLIATELLVGHDLGSVPDDTPMVPLARDLAKAQKRLRLPASAAPKTLELDLRRDTDRQRSQLLHRLAVLAIDWGQPADTRGLHQPPPRHTGRTGGTFKEAWALQWHPSFEVALVEASAKGTTIEAAATATLTDAAAAAADPGDVAALVEAALLAELPSALEAVTATLAERAAQQRDTVRLMAAVEPLARTRRYGNVRQVDTEAVAPVLAGLLTRVAVGLPAAVAAVDDDAAAGLAELVESVDRAVGLLDDPALRRPWLTALRAVADQRGVHGLLAGEAVRVLLDSGALEPGDVQRRLSRALSPAEDAARGAAWIEGFLTGDASLLLHDPPLLRVVDEWITTTPGPIFDELLPVLRRTFATFPAPDRRALGSHLRRLEEGDDARPGADDTLDRHRAARVLPRLRDLLGTGA